MNTAEFRHTQHIERVVPPNYTQYGKVCEVGLMSTMKTCYMDDIPMIEPGLGFTGTIHSWFFFLAAIWVIYCRRRYANT